MLDLSQSESLNVSRLSREKILNAKQSRLWQNERSLEQPGTRQESLGESPPLHARICREMRISVRQRERIFFVSVPEQALKECSRKDAHKRATSSKSSCSQLSAHICDHCNQGPMSAIMLMCAMVRPGLLFGCKMCRLHCDCVPPLEKVPSVGKLPSRCRTGVKHVQYKLCWSLAYSPHKPPCKKCTAS